MAASREGQFVGPIRNPLIELGKIELAITQLELAQELDGKTWWQTYLRALASLRASRMEAMVSAVDHETMMEARAQVRLLAMLQGLNRPDPSRLKALQQKAEALRYEAETLQDSDLLLRPETGAQPKPKE